MRVYTASMRLAAKVRFRRALAALTLLGSTLAQASPYTPAHADIVLERLPTSLIATTKTEVRQLHQQLAVSPDNAALASRLASVYIQQGKTDSDPRYFGYAQAALSPWWKLTDPPASVRLMRAVLNQGHHDFDAAIIDLEALVRNDSNHAHAWLLLANTNLVMGRNRKAEAACSAVAKSAHSSVATLCYSGVMSRSGRADEAYQLLGVLARQFQRQADANLQWILTAQAEAAVMLGWQDRANVAFEAALAIDHRDTYLLSAYADFLLAQQRNDEVLTLLENETRDLALLLRAAIAAHRSNQQPLAATYRQQLRTRFAAEQLRGSQLHNREAALFQLQVEANAERALKLASANWAVQKEPLDAQILLQAALAADDTAALKSVTDWLTKSGMQDARLQPLLATL